MNLRKAIIVTTFTYFASLAHAATELPAFSPEQEQAIGNIAAAYLIDHPEILVQVSQSLQKKQAERQREQFSDAAVKYRSLLLSNSDTPSVGPDNARVAVVEFFDYQCIYCNRTAPVIENVMKKNPGVRFIFKEWPIFADRWEISRTAAVRGLQVWKQKGAAGYMQYHNGLYQTGHYEGALTADDIAKTSQAVAFDNKQAVSLEAALAMLQDTNTLAQAMGISGTPALVVMPVTNARQENTTVIPGAASAEDLQHAIDRASQP
jgi:protein-disulfide isomerase